MWSRMVMATKGVVRTTLFSYIGSSSHRPDGRLRDPSVIKDNGLVTLYMLNSGLDRFQSQTCMIFSSPGDYSAIKLCVLRWWHCRFTVSNSQRWICPGKRLASSAVYKFKVTVQYWATNIMVMNDKAIPFYDFPVQFCSVPVLLTSHLHVACSMIKKNPYLRQLGCNSNAPLPQM